jgi:hypothetical protein
MPTNNAKGLEEVLGLLAEMSPGPLECGNGAEVEPATFIYCDDTLGSAVANCAFSHTVAVSREQERRNAAGFAAAVNYLRSHGAAIAAREEAAQTVFDCILRGINDGNVARFGDGWIRSWARKMIAAGFAPTNPNAVDIRAALRQVEGQ